MRDVDQFDVQHEGVEWVLLSDMGTEVFGSPTMNGMRSSIGTRVIAVVGTTFVGGSANTIPVVGRETALNSANSSPGANGSRSVISNFSEQPPSMTQRLASC